MEGYSWWKVTVRCKGHPEQPEAHARYVQSGTAEAAAKRAVAQFRSDHWYTKEVEVLDVEESPIVPAVISRKQSRPKGAPNPRMRGRGV